MQHDANMVFSLSEHCDLKNVTYLDGYQEYVPPVKLETHICLVFMKGNENRREARRHAASIVLQTK